MSIHEAYAEIAALTPQQFQGYWAELTSKEKKEMLVAYRQLMREKLVSPDAMPAWQHQHFLQAKKTLHRSLGINRQSSALLCGILAVVCLLVGFATLPLSGLGFIGVGFGVFFLLVTITAARKKGTSNTKNAVATVNSDETKKAPVPICFKTRTNSDCAPQSAPEPALHLKHVKSLP